jgi:hypothetical protein
MKSIWKFKLPIEALFMLEMPAGAQRLKVDMQYGNPHLWALVDPFENVKQKYCFSWVGTGKMCEDIGEYVDTVQVDTFVFHLFYIGIHE